MHRRLKTKCYKQHRRGDPASCSEYQHTTTNQNILPHALHKTTIIKSSMGKKFISPSLSLCSRFQCSNRPTAMQETQCCNVRPTCTDDTFHSASKLQQSPLFCSFFTQLFPQYLAGRRFGDRIAETDLCVPDLVVCERLQ